MSVFQSIETNYSCKSKKRSKLYMPESLRIQYNIDKNSVQNIMENVLSQYCKMKIYGYNKQDNFYWCKEQNKCVCTLHISISVATCDYNKTYITITPLLGNELEIRSFIQKFKTAMKLYEKSSFIYEYLESN